MSRHRTGTTFAKHGIRQIAITTDRPGAPRARWVRACPPGADGHPLSEIEAKKVALDLQRQYDAGTFDPWAAVPVKTVAVADETVDKWFERWVEDRETRGLTSTRTDRSRYKTHLAPVLGTLPMREVSKAQIENLVEHLDRRVRKNELAWKTATSAWGVCSKMFGDACSAKSRSLRVRTDDPTRDVAPPDRGVHKVKQYLTPVEFMDLVSCRAVPLVWRRIYAVAVYLYVRAGELEALKWDDLDLDRGTAHVHCAIDYDTDEVKPIKTKESRRFSVERTVLPLLKVMRGDASGTERLWPKSAIRNNDADLLRTHLKLAGVTRADLFVTDATRKNVTFHDLRATGITWMAMRGDANSLVQRRAGHTSFQTTDGYIREAETVRDGFGEVFPPLPAELLGIDHDDPEDPPDGGPNGGSDAPPSVAETVVNGLENAVNGSSHETETPIFALVRDSSRHSRDFKSPSSH